MRIHHEIAIDLGTANTLAYSREEGLFYNEPSYVAFKKENNNNHIIAMGTEAKMMTGRTGASIEALRPMLDGVISEYLAIVPMVERIIKMNKHRAIGKKLTISVPYGVTEIEMRAVADLGRQVGFSKMEIVDEPVVAALGEGIDIHSSRGCMLVDIGAGTTDIAVICLGGIVVGKSVKFAGDDFDEAIMNYILDKYRLSIGNLTAEKLKKQLTDSDAAEIPAAGLNCVTGLPEQVMVAKKELQNVLIPVIDKVAQAIRDVLELVPPELISDIMQDGIYLTGGGSMVPLVKERLNHLFEITFLHSQYPLMSVGNGLMKKLSGISVPMKYCANAE